MIRRPPSSTLFPYPTLFRPRWPRRLPAHAAPGACAPCAHGPNATRPRRAALALDALDEERDAHVRAPLGQILARSEEHTSELQSRQYLVCRLLLEKIKLLQ